MPQVIKINNIQQLKRLQELMKKQQQANINKQKILNKIGGKIK